MVHTAIGMYIHVPLVHCYCEYLTSFVNDRMNKRQKVAVTCELNSYTRFMCRYVFCDPGKHS